MIKSDYLIMLKLKSFAGLLSFEFKTPELGALAFSAITLITTLVGIFRERIFASLIGPGPILDAYVLAHKIPDILYTSTAALFVAATVLPYLAKEETEEEKKQMLSEFFTILLYGSVALSVIGIIIIPTIIPLLGPGFSP